MHDGDLVGASSVARVSGVESFEFGVGVGVGVSVGVEGEVGPDSHTRRRDEGETKAHHAEPPSNRRNETLRHSSRHVPLHTHGLKPPPTPSEMMETIQPVQPVAPQSPAASPSSSFYNSPRSSSSPHSLPPYTNVDPTSPSLLARLFSCLPLSCRHSCSVDCGCCRRRRAVNNPNHKARHTSSATSSTSLPQGSIALASATDGVPSISSLTPPTKRLTLESPLMRAINDVNKSKKSVGQLRSPKGALSPSSVGQCSSIDESIFGAAFQVPPALVEIPESVSQSSLRIHTSYHHDRTNTPLMLQSHCHQELESPWRRDSESRIRPASPVSNIILVDTASTNGRHQKFRSTTLSAIPLSIVSCHDRSTLPPVGTQPMQPLSHHHLTHAPSTSFINLEPPLSPANGTPAIASTTVPPAYNSYDSTPLLQPFDPRLRLPDRSSVMEPEPQTIIQDHVDYECEDQYQPPTQFFAMKIQQPQVSYPTQPINEYSTITTSTPTHAHKIRPTYRSTTVMSTSSTASPTYSRCSTSTLTTTTITATTTTSSTLLSDSAADAAVTALRKPIAHRPIVHVTSHSTRALPTARPLKITLPTSSAATVSSSPSSPNQSTNDSPITTNFVVMKKARPEPIT